MLAHIVGALLALGSSNAAAQSRSTAVTKGKWQGPARPIIPGPGPSPGQSMQDYFEALKPGPRVPAPANILVIGGSGGYHHDSISAAMAAIHNWGEETGAWRAELRSDFKLLNPSGGGPMNSGFQPKGLADFNAVVIVNAEGEWDISPEQKNALLSFVKQSGKGIVVIHGGIAANHNWPDYIDMIGAEQTGHPFNTLEQPVRSFQIVKEDEKSPAVAALPSKFVKQDELYVVRNWSRDDVNVLLRLDETQLDLTGIEDQVPPDRDMPIAWVKSYGKGRVFASSLGHTRESFADPDIANMYTEAIKWVLGLTDGGMGPHARPQSGAEGSKR